MLGDDGIFVTKIIPGGAAEEQGTLSSGDRILQVSGWSVVLTSLARRPFLDRACKGGEGRGGVRSSPRQFSFWHSFLLPSLAELNCTRITTFHTGVHVRNVHEHVLLSIAGMQ